MVFSSLLFLFVFLPLFLICYWIVPKQFRNLVLFISSLLFYAWGEPVYVLIMIFSTVLDYSCGIIIDRYRHHKLIPKMALCTSMVVNLSMLGFFKYSNFAIENINHFLSTPINFIEVALPIGISFYTFQTMSYTIDLYLNKISVQKNIVSFGAYVSMFPQLVAGPIVAYSFVEKEIDNRTVTKEKFGEGCIRFIEGLGKKVLLANSIGVLWDKVSSTGVEQLSIAGAWLGIIAFALQLYFDFSGYSDMAIGLGKMMGFNFPENFNYPYMAKSCSDFWRRWHMTLGSWFREYVYIPLGGNRKGNTRLYINLFVVWFLTGLWHGASWNFIIWGLFFGVLIALEKAFLLNTLKKLPPVISRVYLIVIVLISWVFFAIDSLEKALSYLKVMFGMNGNVFVSTETLYLLSNFTVLLVLGLLCATPIMNRLKEKLGSWGQYILYVAILVSSTAYLVDSTFNPFLYFRF